MNVFEDLIEELKEENLLERTVTENYYSPNQTKLNEKPIPTKEKAQIDIEPVEKISEEKLLPQENQVVQEKTPESSIIPTISKEENEDFEIPTQTVALNDENLESINFETEQLIQNLNKPSTPFSEEVLQVEAELHSLNKITSDEKNKAEKPPTDIENKLEEELPEYPEYELLSKSVIEDHEFYRRRANEEVISLQIVEHILSAIEKEQMKIVPQTYDDLTVSMALHDFLQAGNNPLSNEHTQAEFKLMQETEKWYSALANRDKVISVGDLRRYCENAKPALSSQALISLARFYRNSPFSESVRSKFDMVLTKLVTRENWDDTRIMLFNRDELVKQLEELYSDWSSIPLYENKEEDSDVLIGVLKFEDFILEANNADSLDELVKNDFFNRIRVFKEGTNEKFFAPLLTGAAVECNVIIGNKYVQLVQNEKAIQNEAELEEKYSFSLDQSVSDTLSKSLRLAELLKEKNEPLKPVVVERPKEIKETLVSEKSSHEINLENEKKEPTRKYKVNKITVAIIILCLTGLGILYTWAELMTPQLKPSPTVKKVDLENNPLNQYFKTARINRDTFFAVTDPNWEKATKDVKEDVLKKTLAEGKDKGYDKIHVLDGEGKTVAFASPQGISLDPN